MHFQVKVGGNEVRFSLLAEKANEADGVPHLTMSHEFAGANA